MAAAASAENEIDDVVVLSYRGGGRAECSGLAVEASSYFFAYLIGQAASRRCARGDDSDAVCASNRVSNNMAAPTSAAVAPATAPHTSAKFGRLFVRRGAGRRRRRRDLWAPCCIDVLAGPALLPCRKLNPPLLGRHTTFGSRGKEENRLWALWPWASVLAGGGGGGVAHFRGNN